MKKPIKNIKKQRSDILDTAKLNPFIRYVRRHFTDAHQSQYVSVCYDCRMIFSTGATGVLYLGEEKYDISNNTAVFLPPGTHYRFFFNKDEKGMAIFINFDAVSDFSYLEKSLGTATEESFDEKKVISYPLSEELSHPIIRNVPEIFAMLSDVADNFLSRKDFFREESSALLKLSLIELLRKNRENKHSSLCEEVMKYIHENYGDTELNNESLAEKFSYHPYHLSRIMKEETGKSLHKYLSDYRIRMAKNLLVTTNLSICEIAEESGFGQAAYFVKCFREKTGMTPKKYRASKSFVL